MSKKKKSSEAEPEPKPKRSLAYINGRIYRLDILIGRSLNFETIHRYQAEKEALEKERDSMKV